jgi:hypothetical protein
VIQIYIDFASRLFCGSGDSYPYSLNPDPSFFCSVADPGCLSRILIFTHSGFRIQKQQQKRQKRGVKKIVVKPFFVATNFTKL